MTSQSPRRHVPKFTVWQIYLLSELKNSGLTNEEIQIGVQEIDDLASNKPNIRFHQQQQQNHHHHHHQPQINNSKSKTVPTNHHYANNSGDHYNNNNGTASTGNNSNNVSLIADTTNEMITAVNNGNGQPSRKRTRETSNHGESLSEATASSGNSYYSNSDFASMVYRRGANSLTTPVSAVVTALSNSAGSFVGGSPANGGGGVEEDEVLDPEVAELLSLDVAVVKQQIQEFMAERKITQSYIVKATNNKVSQPYISTWLLNPRSRNFRKVKILYQWYVNEKRKKKPGLDEESSLVSNSLYSNILFSNGKSRFEDLYDLKPSIWPSHCEGYLEEVYKTFEMPPDEMKLVDIAAECTNRIRDHYTQQGHISRELVTTSHVSQWLQDRMAQQQPASIGMLPPPVFDIAEHQQDEVDEAEEDENETIDEVEEHEMKQEDVMVNDAVMA